MTDDPREAELPPWARAELTALRARVDDLSYPEWPGPDPDDTDTDTVVDDLSYPEWLGSDEWLGTDPNDTDTVILRPSPIGGQEPVGLPTGASICYSLPAAPESPITVRVSGQALLLTCAYDSTLAVTSDRPNVLRVQYET